MIKSYLISTICIFFICCQSNTAQDKKNSSKKVQKTELEWKKQLTSLEYNVLREKGTERAFTGKYDKFYENGTYLCKGCDTPLFLSENKFNSGTGWPSFDAGIKGNIGYDSDNYLGYTRTEIHCNTCKGHLGHVFDDGPSETTGKRYCVNSVSLLFAPKKKQD
ncbi:peptide-methionine (R)-S-oxide reductase MsrB [Pseudofulvibacter geojedonensis]|uniref:peptide-methionine (R)-S-oxide reductase n=1 Tax=Pseudofulvibacter geojedonensis TaxID=1123758 RepID=A0ABW3HY71_9FLAO